MLFQSKIIVSQNADINYLISILNLGEIAREINIIQNDGASIGIKEVSDLSEKNSKKSTDLKVFIIIHAEKLTPEAQNSLLKILEEPNQNSLFVLHTINIDRLLETIKSRCEVIYNNSSVEDEDITNIEFIFKDFIELEYKEKVKIVEKFLKDYNNKEYIKKAIIVILNQIAIKKIYLDQVSKIEKAYKAVDRNVSAKLIFDFVIISLQK